MSGGRTEGGAWALARPALKSGTLLVLLAMPALLLPAISPNPARDTPIASLVAMPDEADRPRHYPDFAPVETKGGEPVRMAAAGNRVRARSAASDRLARLKSTWRANPGRVIQIN